MKRFQLHSKKGKYTYFYKNDGLQAQSVLYRKDASGKTEVFLDPNKFSDKGTTSLANLSFNKKRNTSRLQHF